jgi:hypothetical protein
MTIQYVEQVVLELWGGVWRDLVRLDTWNISKGARIHDTRHEKDRKFGFGHGGLFHAVQINILLLV